MGIYKDKEDKMLRTCMEQFIRLKKTGMHQDALELLEGVVNLYINMATMLYAIDIKDHQACPDGDKCLFYEALAEHLEGSYTAMRKDIERCLQMNLHFMKLKFPGWNPEYKLTDEDRAEADDGKNVLEVYKPNDPIEAIKQALEKQGATVVRGSGLADLLRAIATMSGEKPDPSKLN